MTYMLLLNCALKLVEEIILVYSWLDQWQRVRISVRENFDLLLGCHFTADYETY